MPRIPLGSWVDSAVTWLQNNLSWLFDAVSWLVNHLYDWIFDVLSAPEPLLLAGIFAVIAWWLRSLVAGVLAFVGFALIDSVELWDHAMQTLSLVLVATVLTLVIGVPLGVWAARSKTVSSVFRPVLDFMQTMPAMVYLIPGVIFFGVGVVPGIIATIVFALPPGVRMTELGIRQVDQELVEAADAFGTPPRQTLLRVQIPLAMQTIMAGVTQNVMLALSMVVIAGMVGGGGLGGDVFQAIGNVNIGLGFEAGISIVIVAIYLDRMTGALGQQVSPVGRRSLAKAREMASGIARLKVANHRPQPVVALVGVVVLALAAGGIGVFGGTDTAPSRPATASSDVGHGKAVSIGYFPWDEDIATTFLWQEILKERGFKPTVKQYDAGPLFQGMANGQVDFQTDTWLPTTHAAYWKKYGSKLDDLGAWYQQTSLEIAVPSYVKGVKTMADLKGRADEFGGRIIGIEPSAGEMGLLKSKVLKAYGLDKEYQLTDGSTASMLSELKRDYAQHKPVAVVLWSPHWAYSTYKLTKLADPKGAWGKGDSIHTVTRKGFSQENPAVGNWLRHFSMSDTQLSDLEAEIQKYGTGHEAAAVKAWLKAHPGLVDKWAPLPQQDKSTRAAVAKEAARPINVAWFPWDEDIAATYLWKEVLGERGYTMNLKQFDVGPMYTALSRGQLDVQFDGWLPYTQKPYWDKYHNDLTKIGYWYGPTSLEVAVPRYVKGVKSYADLKGRGKEFGNRIIGIEPGTEEMNLLKHRVLPAYGLDQEYTVVDGSTAGMLAELKRDYAEKKPVAVVLWSPHWAYSTYRLTKLADPKKAFGTGDKLTTVASKKFPQQYPQLTKWLKNFHMSDADLGGLESQIKKAGTGHESEAVKAWMAKHPGIVDTMAPM